MTKKYLTLLFLLPTFIGCDLLQEEQTQDASADSQVDFLDDGSVDANDGFDANSASDAGFSYEDSDHDQDENIDVSDSYASDDGSVLGDDSTSEDYDNEINDNSEGSGMDSQIDDMSEEDSSVDDNDTDVSEEDNLLDDNESESIEETPLYETFVRAGSYHTCAVVDGYEGYVRCWGYNNYGQLGDGTTDLQTTPIHVLDDTGENSLAGVVDIALGAYHSCALFDTGNVQCWGYNNYGQLGDGTQVDRTLPTNVLDSTGTDVLSDIVAIAAGEFQTCAMLQSGGVQCWGDNSYGQLGDGTKTLSTKPVTTVDLTGTGALSGVSSIATGRAHTCAVLDSGNAVCWGNNKYGQIGDGNDYTVNTKPTIVKDETGPGTLTGVQQLAAGYEHTCALLDTKKVLCWGSNKYFQTGNSIIWDYSYLLPNYVLASKGPNGLSNVISIEAGIYHTCALLNTGNLQCWGWNLQAQLGEGTLYAHVRPVDVKDESASGSLANVKSFALGEDHSCALTESDQMLCWGDHTYGQLGLGGKASSYLPIAVEHFSDEGADSQVMKVDIGLYHTCALLSSGRVQCWGDNQYGQLGDGTESITSIEPVYVVDSTGEGYLENVIDIDIGQGHTCALLSNSQVQCWGYGYDNIPVDILNSSGTEPITDVEAISTGYHQTCALFNTGTVQCWGSLPEDIFDISGTGTLSGVQQIATGYYGYACALLDTTEVVCWKNSTSWGTGTRTPSYIKYHGSSTHLTGVKAIVAGYNFGCGLLETGHVQCWGDNQYGQLGNGTRGSGTTRYGAVDVLNSTGSDLLSGVAELTGTYKNVCALLDSGEVQCWGYNGGGQHGNGTISSISLPTNVLDEEGIETLDGVTQITTTRRNSCALLDTGEVMCWGNNVYNQLGVRGNHYQTTPVTVLLDENTP